MAIAKKKWKVFILTPKFFTATILNLLFFLAIGFFASCSNQVGTSIKATDISKENRAWMEKFFTDFFLNESTIYTLFGSKPMSLISLCSASKEEWLLGYAKLIQDYPEEKKQEILDSLEKYIDTYDLSINWDKWIDWSSKNLNRSFLFSKRKTEVKDLFSIYVLNVQEAAWILEEHYSSISKELEMEFDPLQVVLEFEDATSPFWEKVFDNHLVQGILHGYGLRNSYFFDRIMGLQEKNDFDLLVHPLFKSAPDRNDGPKELPLPRFRSFSSDLSQDPVYQIYLKEREQIRKILKGKNKFDLILHRLGYQSAVQNSEIAFN